MKKEEQQSLNKSIEATPNKSVETTLNKSVETTLNKSVETILNKSVETTPNKSNFEETNQEEILIEETNKEEIFIEENHKEFIEHETKNLDINIFDSFLEDGYDSESFSQPSFQINSNPILSELGTPQFFNPEKDAFKVNQGDGTTEDFPVEFIQSEDGLYSPAEPPPYFRNTSSNSSFYYDKSKECAQKLSNGDTNNWACLKCHRTTYKSFSALQQHTTDKHKLYLYWQGWMFIKPKRIILFVYPFNSIPSRWWELFLNENLPKRQDCDLMLNKKTDLIASNCKETKQIYVSSDHYKYHRAQKMQMIVDFIDLIRDLFKVYDHILLQTSILYLSDFMISLAELDCDIILYKLNISLINWIQIQPSKVSPGFGFEELQTMDIHFNYYFKKQIKKFTHIIQDFSTEDEKNKVKEELAAFWTVSNASMLN